MTQAAVKQFVIKIHSRCNLACDYCYVYESADQSWRTRPRTISQRTLLAAGSQISAHAERHQFDRVSVTLHGGEPLLVGHEAMASIVETLRVAVEGCAQLDISLQTNGVLLDETFAELFLREGVRVGISLDGGREANDRHRVFPNGASSYDHVASAVRLMTSERYRPIFAGILVTIDPSNDPVQLLEDMVSLQPGKIDLLLPHATWESPPPAALPGRTVYGDWLVTVFDAWYDAPPVVGVRLFEELMHALLGGASTSEAVGLSAPESIVIETDGFFEKSDILKVAFPGAPETGYSVFDHTIEEVLEHPGVRAMAQGLAGLSATCRQCPIVTACGGGLYPHRYSSANGFDNPSVYCHDLGRLINRVQERLTIDLRCLQETADYGAGPVT